MSHTIKGSQTQQFFLDNEVDKAWWPIFSRYPGCRMVKRSGTRKSEDSTVAYLEAKNHKTDCDVSRGFVGFRGVELREFQASFRRFKGGFKGISWGFRRFQGNDQAFQRVSWKSRSVSGVAEKIRLSFRKTQGFQREFRTVIESFRGVSSGLRAFSWEFQDSCGACLSPKNPFPNKFKDEWLDLWVYSKRNLKGNFWRKIFKFVTACVEEVLRNLWRNSCTILPQSSWELLRPK